MNGGMIGLRSVPGVDRRSGVWSLQEIVDARRAGVWPPDDYWDNVVALLHFDGADGSTAFVDQRLHAFTALGNAQLDTAQFKFGTASLLCDGSGDGITTPDSADWEFAGGDFTIETWVRFNSVVASHIVSRANNGDGAGSWILWRNDSAQLEFYYTTNGLLGTARRAQGAWSASAGTWYHLAACRSGADLRLFVDGTQIGTTFNAGTDIIADTTQPMRIGIAPDGGRPHNGWIDDVRITKGVARYTANFTPPTEPFPNA